MSVLEMKCVRSVGRSVGLVGLVRLSSANAVSFFGAMWTFICREVRLIENRVTRAL